ncbi:MAG: acetyl-CoA hydrolase/transferase C-terminal domain-containing protein, partial [Acidimicrobiia bacterium]
MTPRSRRPLIVMADGPGGPGTDPAVIAGLAGLDEPDLLIGFTVEDLPWLDSLPAGRAWSVSAGYRLDKVVAAGTVRYLPVALSGVPRLLAGPFRPDVAVVSGRPAGGGYVFGPSVGWAHAAARLARRVIIEVQAEAPPYDAPAIPGEVVAVIEAPGRPPAVRARPPTPLELTIGAAAAALVPPRAVIQYGAGAVCEAVVAGLDVPVQVRSGLVSDALVDLDRRGLLAGRAEAAYAWGGDDLTALSAGGKLRLVPVERSHDVGLLAGLERFVAINTAVQVALDGSVNVEQVGGRRVAGIGGHPDFCAAAVRSKGGLSIIVLPATR